MSFSPPGPHTSAYGSGTVFASCTPPLLEFPALRVSHTENPHPLPLQRGLGCVQWEQTVSVRGGTEAARAQAPRRESCRSGKPRLKPQRKRARAGGG